MRAHARLGASNAARWMSCPGSARLEAEFEEPIGLSLGLGGLTKAPTSQYAEEGTAAHMLAERCLRHGYEAEELLGHAFNGYLVDQEMADDVQVYLDAVRSEVGPGDVLMLEQRFTLNALNPPAEMFGTCDAAIYKPALQHLLVFDLKFGRGVTVEVTGNAQSRYYALGACMALAEPVLEIEVVIVQPRAPHSDGAVRRERLGAFELIEWAADLMEAAGRTLDPEAPLIAGEHCRFCLAHGACPALREHALATAQTEFDTPADLSPDEIGALLDRAEMIELWLRALRAHAHAELEAGRSITGWKLVQKRAVRRWRDEEWTSTALHELGVADTDMFTLKSPAQVEKVLGKRKKAIADLVIAESSGSTLARAKEGREAITPSAGAEFFIEGQ
jgi:Protein of unknown function (DUF2800)